MNNRHLIKIILISIILLPLVMIFCGQNGFYVTSDCHSGESCLMVNLGHISTMRNLLTIGLITSILVVVWLVFSQQILSLMKNIRKKFLNNFNYYKCILGRMKPFDPLLMAYSSGLIQPKTFCK